MESNCILYKEWDGITYPFLKFNGASNFIPHFAEYELLIQAGIKVNPS